MELQGLNNDGTPNPSIAPLLDVENYIDYLIVNVWAGCDDWPHHNFWAGRDRDPDTTEGFQFFLWDFDSGMHVNEKWSPLDTKTFDQGFTGTYNVGQAHDYLQWNPEYQLAFADHVHKWFFNDGILTTDSLIARYQEISDRVEEMMVAESARWGDMNSPTPTPIVLTDWQYERDYMLNTYLPQRSDIVMQEMREYGFYPDTDAPVFSQHGGQVESGYDLSITAPTGTIYYTLDGSDPRLVGGSVSPTALVYTGATVDITAGMTVKARVLSGSEWSALNEAAFTIAPPAAAGNFAITELNYNPHGPNPVAGMGELDVDSNEFEFIELTNTGAETIDLTGVTIAGGVTYAFTAQTLDPGQSVLVVENQAAFESRFGTSLNVAGQYGGKLSNGGEPLTLLDTFGQQILSFEYSDGDGWPERADGDGSSLEVVDTSGDYDDPLNWRASADYGGSPAPWASGRRPTSSSTSYSPTATAQAPTRSSSTTPPAWPSISTAGTSATTPPTSPSSSSRAPRPSPPAATSCSASPSWASRSTGRTANRSGSSRPTPRRVSRCASPTPSCSTRPPPTSPWAAG